MGKVFIVNKAGHDFSNATKFGELVYITTGNINVFRPDRDLFRIQSVLKDFDIYEDYLLLSGHVFANAMCVSVIASTWENFNTPNLKFLVYDAKNQKYMCHVFTTNEAKELVFKRDANDTNNVQG